jgi:hypothetical protein
VSRATRIVGGEAMDSPQRQCLRTLPSLCSNIPLTCQISPLRFFHVPQMQIGAVTVAFGGCDNS